MKFKRQVHFLLLVSLVVASSLAFANEERPEVTIEGLQLIDDSNLALVYAEPGIDFGRYNKIYLDDPYIAFKKNWQRNQNRIEAGKITANDMLKIKMELSSLFMDVFSKTLEDGGYELVFEAGEDVLPLVKAKLGLL